MEKCEMCGSEMKEILLDTIYVFRNGVKVPVDSGQGKEILIVCTKCPFARR
ncbi:hypothetical protein HZA97_07250 [Candidatus Woesearchaeota archaeon]|nr:hypothetical protein [Candidatus Woesearchaeota archaeon]